MSDILKNVKRNSEAIDYRVMFGEIKCDKSEFNSIDEIEKFGIAIHNAKKMIEMEWFLTCEVNGSRFLLPGDINRGVSFAIINIDIDDNVNILSSPEFEKRLNFGFVRGFSVKIKGMDNITQEDISRGGFWCVFSGSYLSNH